MDLRDILKSSLTASGIDHFAFLDEPRLLAACEETDDATLERYGLQAPMGPQSAVAVALPYGEGPELPPPWAQGYLAEHPGPSSRIGRFARANWYAELVARLKEASSLAQAKLAASGVEPGNAREWRKLVNSGLPEKRIALASGLGSLGRNGLVMIPGHGSAVILGLLILPLALEEDARRPAPQSAARISALCEGCGLCLSACPTGALSVPRSGETARVCFDRKLCLQHWSSVSPSDSGEIPKEVEAAWRGGAGGDLLYGCDICQEACPYFKPDPDAKTDRGLLGPGLPASWFLSASDAEIKAALKGSALGMSWISIEALRRGARHTMDICEI